MSVRISLIVLCTAAVLWVASVATSHTPSWFARWNIIAAGYPFARVIKAPDYGSAPTATFDSSVMAAARVYQRTNLVGWIDLNGYFHETANPNLSRVRRGIIILVWIQRILLGALMLAAASLLISCVATHRTFPNGS
jgi:hypothetical protein